MSSQDRLENVLRDIHVMISKSETYDTDRIIVRKQDIFNLIDRLNASIYEIMDEYELTQQSRDRAMREKKKEGDKIIWDASRQAEDIYAASVLYTEEALNHLNVMVDEADATVDRMYREFRKNIKLQQETIRENQLELKSQLQLLADTEKYLRLIEERNREIERERAEKKGRKTLENFGEKHTVIKPEIKINEEYFRKAGIPFEKDEDKSAEDEELMQPLEDEGVIESTLKKAAEDIQQLFTEDKKQEKNAKKAVQKEKIQEESKSQEKMAVSSSTESDQAVSSEQAAASDELIQKSPAEQPHAPADTGIMVSDTSPAGTGSSVSAASPADTDSSVSAASPADTGSSVSGALSADTAQEQMLAGKDTVNAAEAEIRVNMDAEYFRQKGEETEEGKKHSQNEKLSLLDRLMGKKKTLL